MKKIAYFFMIFNTLYANAQDESVTSDEIKEILSNNTYEPNYFGMILGLFVVIALIYITGFLYQKLTKVNSNIQKISPKKVQVISTTSLGQGKNLHIVRVGDESILIGSTQNNITYIKDVKLQDEKESKDNDKDSKNS